MKNRPPYGSLKKSNPKKKTYTLKPTIKEWYCYICGKKLDNNYHLVSGNKSTDRVFLVCDNKCVDQIEEEYLIIKIKEIK